jgi:hypothetical protein
LFATIQAVKKQSQLALPLILLLFLLLRLRVFVLEIVAVPNATFPVLLQLLPILLTDRHTFDALDCIPLNEHDETPNGCDDAG